MPNFCRLLSCGLLRIYPNNSYHGNSYRIWQNESQLQICEQTPTSSNCSASANLSAANGETHTYRATYNPANGQLSVWRDGVFALTWTDSTPLTGGNHIAFRTQNSSVRFDNIRATTTSSSLYYFFTDHLGSTSVLSDSSGNEVAGSRTRHLPFGGWRGTAPTQTITDRAFTGQKENMEVGLLYYNARYYLPNTNRMISPDTIVPDPTNPQSYNRYSYTRNNPINLIDPSGHRECGAGDGCSGEALPGIEPPQRETRGSAPDIIKKVTKFNTLPFDLSAYTKGWVQGFGDSHFAWQTRMYKDFGYLHPGVDIPIAEGTELLALGDGEVWCGGGAETFCGQGSTSGGNGITILYYSCKCLVYYVHATNVLAEGTLVSLGDVVGVSGKSPILAWDAQEKRYVETGKYYEHLHLEIRNMTEDIAYNPVYFFNNPLWNSMELHYMDYQNNYTNPHIRMYAIGVERGHDYWRGPSFPYVLVKN